MADAKAALVIGAGDATGGAIARRFAREGFTACVTRRTADKLAPLVAQIESRGRQGARLRLRCAQGGGDGGAGRRPSSARSARSRSRSSTSAPTCAFPIRETTARVYFKVWEMACFAGFLMGREVAKAWCRAAAARSCSPAPPPACAAASGFAAFAGAKHALRALAQSMARELGPQGIHVAHVVIDGAIDTEFIRTQFSRALRAEGARRHPQSRRHRRGLLAAARPAAQRLDPRAGPAPWIETW